ncbi:ImmA/IrrE family metallo-endopeptidase [Actinoplanes sp. NPDC049596]|uniref:ImmA/IrrE family metallo-endopeptidase n=1 Tax=unclassified Actinoplanes TaxID=2626549 RepID=UPI00344A8A8E
MNGVRVFSLAPEYSDVDAFSFWEKGTPIVVLNTLKTGERGRFDAAHELGHLVLHGHNGCSDWDRDSERDANTFASSFLMPRLSVRSRIPSNPTTDQILRGKRFWRVAALALAYRVNDVGMFSEWNYRRCLIELAKLGYRTTEPNGIDRERSQVLQKVFTGLRQQKITARVFAADLGLRLEDLNALTFGLFVGAVDGGGEEERLSPRPDGLRLVVGGKP